MSLLDFGFKKNPNQSEGSDASTSAVVPVESEEGAHSVSEPDPKRKRKEPIRKYDDSYLEFGFICVGTSELPLPKCIVCNAKLSNSSMKPAFLKRHLEAKHPELAEKNIKYFQELKIEKEQQSEIMVEYASSAGLNAIKSSYVAALRIAKENKPFTTGERLLKPMLMEITEIMLGKAEAKKMESVPLSNDTISRRVNDMSTDIRNQLCSELKKAGNFALQFDESTDIAGESILIGFVRYPRLNGIVEELFCFCSLPERTTGADIFGAIDTKMNEYQLDWKNVVGLCTDGAAAMVGVHVGLATKVATIANQDFLATHCILHREALASKQLSPELNTTLQNAVKLINNVKAAPLHSRIFAKICAEEDSKHTTLLLHTEIRWLSRGRTLARVYELRSELAKYFDKYMEPILKKREKKKSKNKKAGEEKLPEEYFQEYLKDEKWMVNLAYLVDIFDQLNQLNLQTQGKNMDCFQFSDKIEAFQKKLLFWKGKAQNGQFDMFLLTEDSLDKHDALLKYAQPIIVNHLQQLIQQFEKMFPAEKDPRVNHSWIIDPFANLNKNNSLTTMEQNQLIGKYIFIHFHEN